MRLYSIMTVIFVRDNNCQHFTLDARERRLSHHGRDVERDTFPHSARVNGHDVNNMPDSTGALDGFIELRF